MCLYVYVCAHTLDWRAGYIAGRCLADKKGVASWQQKLVTSSGMRLFAYLQIDCCLQGGLIQAGAPLSKWCKDCLVSFSVLFLCKLAKACKRKETLTTFPAPHHNSITYFEKTLALTCAHTQKIYTYAYTHTCTRTHAHIHTHALALLRNQWRVYFVQFLVLKSSCIISEGATWRGYSPSYNMKPSKHPQRLPPTEWPSLERLCGGCQNESNPCERHLHRLTPSWRIVWWLPK
jgi:hypothetical protein